LQTDIASMPCIDFVVHGKDMFSSSPHRFQVGNGDLGKAMRPVEPYFRTLKEGFGEHLHFYLRRLTYPNPNEDVCTNPLTSHLYSI
jgi:hypothetical protein